MNISATINSRQPALIRALMALMLALLAGMARPQGAPARLPQLTGGLKGYISMNVSRPPDGYGYGVSFYSSVWPLVASPLASFQIGLPSTWIIPDNLDLREPLCPPGTFARDNWPERGPTYRDVFQTIEGGLGYWVSTQFGAATPKYRVNGTPDGYTHEISSTGWGFGNPTPLAGDIMGIAQISNRLLVPPDGLTFGPGANGQLLGNAWMALPFTQARSDAGVPTGDQSWTLFLNAANYRGPVVTWIPQTWSRLSRRYAAISGRRLDARPAILNGGAMEINTVPYFESKDTAGIAYSRLPKLQFPVDAQGRTVLMQDVKMYGTGALYRAMKAWLEGGAEVAGRSIPAPQTPQVRPLASFEDGKPAPFTGSEPDSLSVEANHATRGRYALRLNRGYAMWQGPQDWTGYDFLKADAYNPGNAPVSLYIEVRDQATQDYWTRVNYQTVLPPGASTLILPADLYVGEKSRPGRPLDKAHITTFVLSISDQKAPIYFDNLRLERDLSDRIKVPGLRAFSFGPGTAPPLRGFTAVTPATVYSAGRGYGLKNAQIWKACDALQPDPLYATGICIEHGGFAIDLPNGKYHVFLNIDSPSGFWGEYQVYRKRTVKANGAPVVQDTMDLPRFLKKYFRFADVEDRPGDNTFDKYQRAYFQEKQFDVEVKYGQLFLEFEGETWANYVSTLVIYPAERAALGRSYLANLQERRRFYFDNYFKRVLPDGRRDAKGAIPAFAPTPAETAQGYALFVRDWMQDIPVNAVPRREETGKRLDAFANAGKLQPLVFSLYPLRDCGTVTVSVSDLKSADGMVPASTVQCGVVSHRLTRVTGEGTVYTIAPRFIMPRSSAQIQKGTTTTFWLTLHTPEHVKSGLYRGKVLLRFADGRTDSLPLSVRLYATPLDPLDIAAGPWGSGLSLPWYDSDLGDYRREMYRKSLARMREYGCTTFSGIPTLSLRGWKNRQPEIDFSQADQEMEDARALGFHSVVVNYNGGIQGFNNYVIDAAAMKSAGFDNYVAFLRAILTAVDAHARQAGWLPVAYNLCDEPIGDAAREAAANARAWREAAPHDIITTGATSIDSSAPPNDPHIELSRALRVANLNGHDEPALQALKADGGQWAFYNGGNRWTYGVYMFKCAQQYGMRWRLDWYWNAAAGDPYYALDCREDDYAWVVTNARRELIPILHFEREIREGIDDYRTMLTLARLLRAKPDHPAARAGRQLLEEKLAAFKLGERNHDAKWPSSEYGDYRRKLAEAIDRMSHDGKTAHAD